MHNHNKKIFNKKGFTLIELLVVISVIGLLSTLAVIALDNARIKARNARRKSDVTQIIKALELYANAHGGAYPSTGGPTYTAASLKCLGMTTSQGCFNADRHHGLDSLKTALDPYLSKMPGDPTRNDVNFDKYLYSSVCHQDHYSIANKPCIYWQTEGTVNAAECAPGGVGSSGGDVCGASCTFCTTGVSN
ncbi:MAG: type II secretion system protein [bacterium]